MHEGILVYDKVSLGLRLRNDRHLVYISPMIGPMPVPPAGTEPEPPCPLVPPSGPESEPPCPPVPPAGTEPVPPCPPVPLAGPEPTLCGTVPEPTSS